MDRGELLIEDLKTGVQEFEALSLPWYTRCRQMGQLLGNAHCGHAAKRRSPALPRLGDHHVPVNVQSREVVEGRGSQASA